MGCKVGLRKMSEMYVGIDVSKDRLDVAWCSTEHLLGLAADSEDPLLTARIPGNRDNGRLTAHDPFAFDVDQRRGRTEIDGQVVRE